jgi:hypothetical protein
MFRAGEVNHDGSARIPIPLAQNGERQARRRMVENPAEKAENAKRREGNLSAFAVNSSVVLSPLLDSQLPECTELRTTFQKCAPES